MTKIKPFISKYNWEGISFPSEKGDREKFEKNNKTIGLMFRMLKMKKTYLIVRN